MVITFPRRLRMARKSKGWSQTELAMKAGFHPSAIAHFELANRSPTIKNLVRLAVALCVKTDWLLGMEK